MAHRRPIDSRAAVFLWFSHVYRPISKAQTINMRKLLRASCEQIKLSGLAWGQKYASAQLAKFEKIKEVRVSLISQIREIRS